MDNWLETDEHEEAVSALEHARISLETVPSDVYSWKWVVVALHNALQGFMVLATRGSNGLLCLQEDVAAKWLEAYRSGGPYPNERLDDFLNLYKKIKSDRLRFYEHSQPFTPTGSQGRSVKLLNKLRNDLIHFVPRSWGLEVSGLPDIGLDCIAVIEFLGWSCGNVMWHGREEIERRAKEALVCVRTQLEGLQSSYAKTAD